MTIGAADLRAEFPALTEWTYLNTATYGLMPRRAVAADAAHWARRDAFACSDFLAWYDDADRIRASIARLIHAAPADIAFVPNGATSLGLLVAGLAWQPGDNVVTLDGEFPNCLYLPALLEPHRVSTRQVAWDPAEAVRDILAAIDDRTRLVALSEVNYATGARVPVEALSGPLHDRGVLLYVDGTQSVGGLAWDVRRNRPDLLAVHGYKWLLSPTGAGFMFVAPELRARLRPTTVGWRSHRGWRQVDDLHEGVPVLSASAERYEGGGLPFGLLNAMGAVVDWMLELGPEAIERAILDLARSARARLERLGAVSDHAGGAPSGIVAVRWPGQDVSALARALQAERILVAARHGYLRISPHFYNDEKDLDRLERALGRLVSGSLGNEPSRW